MTEEKQKHINLRKRAKILLGKYRYMQVTWKSFDCGISDDGVLIGCEECVVCKYRNFIDWAESVGTGVIQYDKFIESYNKIVYSVN